MKQGDADKKQKYVNQAATLILQLDRSKITLADYLRKKFDDLLKQEPPLQRQYNELKKGEKAVLQK
jgi:hypothetical protein